MILGRLKKHLNSNEDFIKIYKEDSDLGYFIEADVQQIYINFTMIYPFYLKE